MTAVPTSFSRILSEQDLQQVREQYLSALADLEDDDGAGPLDPGSAPPPSDPAATEE